MESQLSNTNDNQPWDLMMQSLQGQLSPDQELQFNEWLNASPANSETFDRIKKIWHEGLDHYDVYQQMNPNEGWKDLMGRIKPLASQDPGETRIIGFNAGNKAHDYNRTRFIRWMAAATFLLLIGGSAWWYKMNRMVGYETIAGEVKKVALPDGSTIDLQPDTRIQLGAAYNDKDRKLSLLKGKAFFDIAHQDNKPFVIDVGEAVIKDIGTSFTITKNEDSIVVAVSSGKIAFSTNSTGETRDLSAGDELCLYTAPNRKGQIRSTQALRFDNTPLSAVIDTLQKHFRTHITLQDTTMADKKLTLHLSHEGLDDIIQIVAASLDVEASKVDSGYILKKKPL